MLLVFTAIQLNDFKVTGAQLGGWASVVVNCLQINMSIDFTKYLPQPPRCQESQENWKKAEQPIAWVRDTTDTQLNGLSTLSIRDHDFMGVIKIRECFRVLEAYFVAEWRMVH